MGKAVGFGWKFVDRTHYQVNDYGAVFPAQACCQFYIWDIYRITIRGTYQIQTIAIGRKNVADLSEDIDLVALKKILSSNLQTINICFLNFGLSITQIHYELFFIFGGHFVHFIHDDGFGDRPQTTGT